MASSDSSYGLMQILPPLPFPEAGVVPGLHAIPPALASPVSGSGYARGGSLPRGTGFSGAGELGLTEEPAGPDLVLGPVTGYRWWTLAAPDFSRDPLSADEHWPRERLRGQMAEWQPGLNLAECLRAVRMTEHDPGGVPLLTCSCGYWAYWAPQESPLTRRGTVQVLGVVRASGRVLLGDEGFRAAKARLLAVHLPFTLAVTAEEVRPVPRPDLAGALARAGFTGKVHDWGYRGYQQELETYRRDVTPAEDPEGHARAEAWMAVIGDRIGQLYPGVRVLETRDALLRLFPPDARYAPRPEPETCGRCGQAYAADGALRHPAQCSHAVPTYNRDRANRWLLP